MTRSLTPQWDLTLVLRALVKAPFEPLDPVPLKFVSAKTALLLALTSTKRVRDLSPLSVAPSCLRIQGDGSSAILRPNPAFTPKSITSSFRSRVITLNGFSLRPHQSEEEATAHLLCPVRALACSVKRTEALRKSQRLFAHYGEHSQGLPLTKQRLSLLFLISRHRFAGRDADSFAARMPRRERLLLAPANRAVGRDCCTRTGLPVSALRRGRGRAGTRCSL